MEIQPADLAYRRRVVRTLVAVAILLLGLFVVFQLWLWRISSGLSPVQSAQWIVRMQLACATLVALCLGVLGAHLFARGSRIVRDRRFPPNGARAVRAMAVREGSAAVIQHRNLRRFLVARRH